MMRPALTHSYVWGPWEHQEAPGGRVHADTYALDSPAQQSQTKQEFCFSLRALHVESTEMVSKFTLKNHDEVQKCRAACTNYE